MSESQQERRSEELRLAEEAAYWQIILLDGEVPKSTQREFLRWMKASPQHIAAFLRSSQIESRLQRMESQPWRDLEASSDNVISFPPAPVGSAAGLNEPSRRSEALSRTYLTSLRKRLSVVKLSLVLLATLSMLPCIFLGSWQPLGVAGVSVACLVLLTLKERLMNYRIEKGFFGNTESEARALIEFIVENAKEIDFNDGNGKRRPSLMAEESPQAAGLSEIPSGAVSP